MLIDISTLRVATGNFADSNKLGDGGFGAVYKVLNRNISTKIANHIEILLIELNFGSIY